MNQQNDTDKETSDRLIHAYDRMMQRTEHALRSTPQTGTTLLQALDAARKKAVELGELTEKEADRIHTFLSRDLFDAGRFLAMKERDLADWLRLSLLLIEKEILYRFTTLAQTAKAEIKHLQKAKARFDEWHTGEVTSIGTLRCKKCGELVHFKRTGHIPPCPKCHATVYQRAEQ